MTTAELKQLRDLTLKYYMEIREKTEHSCHFQNALRTIFHGLDIEVTVREGLKQDD